ncbi:MAG: ATP-binding cassette domain-containing protein [Pseudomonadota bacterium]
MSNKADDVLLDIKNATLWRGRTRVFSRLTLTINVGEQVAILGPNGSGKTTLLKTMTRELYPERRDDAWVKIFGRERWNVWDLRRRIGVLSHDLQHAYPGHFPALDVVVSGFHASVGVHGNVASEVVDGQRERARSLLADVGLPDVADTPLSSLSTGQQRRVLLARALVHAPETLVLDEPTSGLDLAGRFELLRLLEERVDCNILLVTHHLTDIPPRIDRVILLHRGRIVADGPKQEVLENKLLSEVFGCAIRVSRIDGYYVASPASGTL